MGPPTVLLASNEEFQFLDRPSWQGLPNDVIFAPQFAAPPIPVEELSRLAGDDFQFEVMPLVIPRVRHLPIRASAKPCRHRKRVVGCFPDSPPSMSSRSRDLRRDRWIRPIHRNKPEVM